MPRVTTDIRIDLAPTGRLRAGINYGNFILAARDRQSGESRGVAIDLTNELARRLDVPLDLIAYDSVAAMVDAARTGAWDIAFLGIDPARANYELYLSRSLQHAQLVRPASASAAFDLLATGQVEALAGLRELLIGLAAKLPGSRVLDGRFMAVQQAVGMPHGRPAGLAYLRRFVEEAKASGLVARAIERTGARGVWVAPRAE